MMENLNDYQQGIATKLVHGFKSHDLMLLWGDMRIGKTRISLHVANILAPQGPILFITKLKAFPSIQADATLMAMQHRVHCVTSQGMTTGGPLKELPKRTPIAFIIYDECHVGLGAFPKKSKSFHALRKLTRDTKLLLMSATPCPESNSSIYHLMTCKEGGCLPLERYKTFSTFVHSYVKVKRKRIGYRSIMDYTDCSNKVWPLIGNQMIRARNEEKPINKCTIVKEHLAVTARVKKLCDNAYKKNILPDSTLAKNRAQVLHAVRQLASGIALNTLIDRTKACFVKDKLSSHKKIVVFYYYENEKRSLRSFFHKNDLTCYLDLQEFNDATAGIGLFQIRAYREGCKMVGATAVIIYTLDYAYLSFKQGFERGISYYEQATDYVIYILITDALSLKNKETRKTITLDNTIYHMVIDKNENFKVSDFAYTL